MIFNFIGIRQTPIPHFPLSGKDTDREAGDRRSRITGGDTERRHDNVTPPDTEIGDDRKLNSSQMAIDLTVVTNLMDINPTARVIKVTETGTKVIMEDIVVMESGSSEREEVIDIIARVGNQQNMK